MDLLIDCHVNFAQKCVVCKYSENFRYENILLAYMHLYFLVIDPKRKGNAL